MLNMSFSNKGMCYKVLWVDYYVEKPLDPARNPVFRLEWGAYPSYLTDGELLSWGVFSIFSQHIEP